MGFISYKIDEVLCPRMGDFLYGPFRFFKVTCGWGIYYLAVFFYFPGGGFFYLPGGGIYYVPGRGM